MNSEKSEQKSILLKHMNRRTTIGIYLANSIFPSNIIHKLGAHQRHAITERPLARRLKLNVITKIKQTPETKSRFIAMIPL